MTDTWNCECLVEQGRARVMVPRVVDASVAHRLRKDLVARINALSDDVGEVTFDLMDTEVLDEAGATAIASAYRHAFLLGLRPTWRAAAPGTRAALLGADGELRTGEHALDAHPG